LLTIGGVYGCLWLLKVWEPLL